MKHLVIGNAYYFETITKDWLGVLVSVDGPYTVTITDYCWVADTGRRAEFFAGGKSEKMEIEPAPAGRLKTLQWIGIEEWPFPLLRETV